MDLGIWNFFFHHISAVFWLSGGKPVVSGGGHRSTRRKPPPNPKSLATFSHEIYVWEDVFIVGSVHISHKFTYEGFTFVFSMARNYIFKYIVPGSVGPPDINILYI